MYRGSVSEPKPERTAAERLADLEARVAELEQRARPAAAPAEAAEASYGERFFALEALKERVPEDGMVVYAGVVPVEGGEPLQWQYGRTVGDIEGLDWSSLAGNLDALGHPVRLSLLQAVHSGTATVAELKERAEFGTSGQIYHHINLLVAAGWLVNRRRGHYVIPPERLVPLMVVLTAAKG
ncbi:helix-turn-helix domain-containing protein [Nocardiopsis exhalans]|uniref:Helix-turn-helix domain-containing protein n=1 Tax=Nocardiopsis exhalans TaxID=163604 RepID=A0ABY5D4X9_9ACTN|nr:helix-turn-helix domain-containing protein [Nocardiopsis exhalans]USY18445.1 helix-turn-helix domain-containing protein [Nocardiopsis exhalans]